MCHAAEKQKVTQASSIVSENSDGSNKNVFSKTKGREMKIMKAGHCRIMVGGFEYL